MSPHYLVKLEMLTWWDNHSTSSKTAWWLGLWKGLEGVVDQNYYSFNNVMAWTGLSGTSLLHTTRDKGMLEGNVSYSLPSRRRNYNTIYNDKFWTVKIKVKKSQREEGSVSWWPSMPYVLLFGYTKRKSWSRVRWQQMRLLRDVEEIGLISARRVTGDIRAGSVAGASYPPPVYPIPFL